MRRAAILFFVAVAAACSGHDSSPTSPLTETPHGTLSGSVTIGPNCPVEQIGNPCPTPPGAYDARKILIETADAKSVLFTVDIDSHGFYRIDLVPGVYTVDLKKNGVDRSSQVPTQITITANHAVTLDIGIDTGIR